MATLVGRFRKFFAPKKRKLPLFIEVDVDPKRHWNVLEDIGEGSFGAVKKVSKKTDPQQLAAFKCTEVQEGEDVEDLAIEVEILLACKHDNVVGILAAYFYDNCLSVMLEYCEGGAVDQIMIELEKALTENQIACILRQVCTGLAFLHSRFVIHRDLKAGNLLLTGDGIVKLADFGVSCMLNGPDEGSNTFIGTPHWMSPEVIRCETMTNLLYNCKSDIWSLGITCIQLAQKEPPYHEMSAERVRLKILRSPKPPTLDNPGGYSAAFRDFIARCLVINPDERCSAVDLLTHPFIVNAVDKKPITILLLEMSADFSEEPVFDNNGSCANSICSSDSTSLWSRQDESSNRPNMNTSMESDNSKSNLEVNGNGQTEFVDHEKTPVVQQNAAIQSKKKRAAPAPPVEPKPDVKFVAVEIATKEEEKISPSGHMSPSGQEAMEILDDLNDVLDENYQHSSAESRPSSAASGSSVNRSDKKSRPRLDSNPKDIHGSSESFSQSKGKFGNSSVSTPEDEYTVIRCGTPTHTIKDITKMYSSDMNSLSPRSGRSRITSTDSDVSRGSKKSNHSKKNQPVTLQVNVDDEEHSSNVSFKSNRSQGSTDSTKVSTTAAVVEIPSGLVKKNRELAQREQLADHAKEEAERIKAQRMREDAAIFGEQHSHVSEIAATLSSKLSSGEGNQSSQMSHSESLSREKQIDRKPSPTKMNNAALPPKPPVADNSYAKTVSNQPFNYFVDENAKHQIESEVPPPEPPIDYDATPKATSEVHKMESTPKTKPRRNVPVTKRTNIEKENAEPRKEPLVRRTPSRQTATKKTRTFTVDGVQVTSTTTHVLEAKQNYELRKEQEREYLRMQREEARQRNTHEKKSVSLQEQQERVFLQEKLNLEKSYQNDIEMISKTQKKKIEDIERAQEEELKQLAKKLKNDQERQIRMFKDQLAREQKILKQEIDMLPKVQRKDTYRFRKEVLDRNQMEREMQFLEKLDREHEMFLDQLRANHREKVANTERSFLEHKHKLEQSMMSALWELEERQLSERHNLNTQQLKELYLLQRSQMIARHQKEQEFVRRHIHEEEDRLMRDLSTNRKNLPKSLRAESKARIRMFKESLHIDYQHVPEKWDQFTQSFEENEKERVKAAIQEYELKCKKRMDALIEENQRLVKELEQIHNEKRSMLCENEQQMLAECEQQFQQLVQESRASRPPRKAELEKRFKEEMDKQIKFYNMTSTNQMA